MKSEVRSRVRREGRDQASFAFPGSHSNFTLRVCRSIGFGCEDRADVRRRRWARRRGAGGRDRVRPMDLRAREGRHVAASDAIEPARRPVRWSNRASSRGERRSGLGAERSALPSPPNPVNRSAPAATTSQEPCQVVAPSAARPARCDRSLRRAIQHHVKDWGPQAPDFIADE